MSNQEFTCQKIFFYLFLAVFYLCKYSWYRCLIYGILSINQPICLRLSKISFIEKNKKGKNSWFSKVDAQGFLDFTRVWVAWWWAIPRDGLWPDGYEGTREGRRALIPSFPCWLRSGGLQDRQVPWVLLREISPLVPLRRAAWTGLPQVWLLLPSVSAPYTLGQATCSLWWTK